MNTRSGSSRSGVVATAIGTDRLAAWAALLRVHAKLVPQLDQELQGVHGLPLTWYDVLLELNSAPGRRLTMSQLGEMAVISRSRVSRVVEDLVKLGLVERVAHPADGRSAYARITPDGRARLRAAAPTYLGAIERHFTSHLTPEEGAAVASALEKVLAGGQSVTAAPSSAASA